MTNLLFSKHSYAVASNNGFKHSGAINQYDRNKQFVRQIELCTIQCRCWNDGSPHGLDSECAFVEFVNPKDAMLFKLTFGGAA